MMPRARECLLLSVLEFRNQEMQDQDNLASKNTCRDTKASSDVNSGTVLSAKPSQFSKAESERAWGSLDARLMVVELSASSSRALHVDHFSWTVLC